MKCKPGYHFVKEHKRISVNGVSHIVEAHCRENLSSKKEIGNNDLPFQAI